MTLWTAFDEQSASLLQQKTQGNVQLASGDALSAALKAGTAALAVLPATTPGHALLITVSRNQGRAAAKPHAAPQTREEEHEVSYVAGGFLGLSDEPVYEEEQPQPKKQWWKKLMS